MFRTISVRAFLAIGLLATTAALQAADTPTLVIDHNNKQQSLPMQGASIRFFGDPCTCADRGSSGRMTLNFSVGEDRKPSAFVAQVIGAVAPEASQGNPGVRVYMPDDSVWVAKRLGHTAVIEKVGDPGIQIISYACRDTYATVTLAIDGKLVYTPSVLAASIGPYDNPERADIDLKQTTLTLQRSLLKSEQCP